MWFHLKRWNRIWQRESLKWLLFNFQWPIDWQSNTISFINGLFRRFSAPSWLKGKTYLLKMSPKINWKILVYVRSCCESRCLCKKRAVLLWQSINWKKESVLLTHRVHPFPFRTRKLSCAVPKILYWRRYGKIGQGRHGLGRGNSPKRPKRRWYTNGGVAQLGEHLPCKQGVMGSNPIISTMESHDSAGNKWR